MSTRFVTRLERLRLMLDRAKLLKRRGVVLTQRDLAEIVALIDAAKATVRAEEDPAMVADLSAALAPFEEMTEPS